MTERSKHKMEKFITMQRLKSFMRQTFDKLYYIVDKICLVIIGTRQ